MITINNIEYRTLEEQVRKNKEDIEVLKNYDISITGRVSDSSELPDTVDNGTMYIVGTSPSYDLYVYVDGWIDLGDYPAIGPKGETGERGPIGLMGEVGSQWYTLQKPPSARQNDQFLDSNGIVYSYTGTNWQATNNIRGPQGIPGVQGEVGPTGPQGPAATIQVGTVTTLEPGQNATVTNSGTSGAAVFNFGIPKGEPGNATLYSHSITITANSGNTGIALTLLNDYNGSIKSFSSLISHMNTFERIPISGGIVDSSNVYPVLYLYKTNTNTLQAYFQRVGSVSSVTWSGSTSGFTIVDSVKKLI